MASHQDSVDPAYDESKLIECCLCTAHIRDPLQLSCLHNCCKACAKQQMATAGAAGVDGTDFTAGVAAVVHDNDAEPTSGWSVFCPICHETTEGTQLSSDVFLDGYFRLHSILSGRPLCELCPAALDAATQVSGAQMTLEEAESLCRNCRKLLCHECFKEHRRMHGAHVIHTLDRYAESADLADSCFPSCPRHGMDYEHACLTCMQPQCGKCATECMAHRHDVQVLHCARVKSSTAGLKSNADNLDLFLDCIAKHREQQKVLTRDLSDARKSGIALLLKNKDAILDAVERAHQKAKAVLLAGCDDLQKEVDEEMTVVDRLQESASRARLVCRSVIDLQQPAAALSKVRPIAERCQQLAAKLQRIQPGDDEKRSVRYMEMPRGQLPNEDELTRIMELLIGLPKLICGTNVVEYANERDIAAEMAEREARLRQRDWEQQEELELELNQEEKLEETLHQLAVSGPMPVSYDQPAFSTSTSPSISITDSYGRALSAQTSGTPTDSDSLVQSSSLDVSEEPLAEQSQLSANFNRVVRQRKPFAVECIDCGSLVTESVNLKLFNAQSAEDEVQVNKHHVVIDMEFPSRVRLHRHWKPVLIGTTIDRGLKIRKEYKVSCKKCSNDWGVCVKIRDKYYFLIKIDTLSITCEGVQEKVKHWKDLPYTLGFISDRTLLTFGHETIPDDYPPPDRWYKPALSK